MQTATAGPAAAKPRQTIEIALAATLALLILFTFWSQQRYPSLLHKLHAGTGVHVAGSISFDALLPVTPAQPAPVRVLRTSVNWLYTNRFGMYFALPFGAALMTLMGSVPTVRRFRSPAANILCGAVVGAPLGVCTNCATPVGQSLLVGGASTRMTLATMISSPSFNPIVVAMAFVLFPLPVAALRVIVPLLLLIALPWLVKELTESPAQKAQQAIRMFEIPVLAPPLPARLSAFSLTYGRNLLRITLLTLPWMLLAAFLGALASQLIPAYGTHIPVSIPGLVALACLGTLLPVPMALDVALAYVLLRTGVPLAYVAVLLCTLGPVSVYSLSALGQQLGRRVVFSLAGTTIVLGTLAGLITLYR
jgi:uncharacterized membrane protein YraQ (UPF0718 family)